MKASYDAYSAIRDSKIINGKRLNDSMVSKAANVTKSTFSDWKKGRSCPKVEKLVKIAQVLGEPLEAFIT